MRIELARPELLLLLALLPIWIAVVWPRAGRGVLFTRGDAAAPRSRGAGIYAAVVQTAPRILRAAALACLVVALAGPERVEMIGEPVLEGKGIALVVDLSSSMLAQDMGDGLDRISVAKDAAVRFARRRVYDELSLVVFGGESMTRVPPTTDPELIAHAVQLLEIQMVRDGTDISGAVLTALSRLLQSEREPRVIVLLTDGAHNGTEVPPLTTARAAAAIGVRIHSISVLSPDDRLLDANAPTGIRRLAAERETVLQSLADMTGGEYFRASSSADLDSIYREIDRLEVPVERMVDREVRYSDRRWFFLAALGLLGVELLLRGSRWGILP